MGLLFSLAIMPVGASVAWSVAYVVARFFLSISLAARAAAVVLSSIVIGDDAHAVGSWEGPAYLVGLLLFAVASGGFAVRSYLTRVRSNKTMEPTQ
jgi:hypothetical protein